MYWEVELNTGAKIAGSLDDGSWKRIKGTLNDGEKICGLRIYNQYGSHTIDKNCDGYFLGRFCSAPLMGEPTLQVGIGYWRKHEPVARIKWYQFPSMNLNRVEVRSIENCGFCLVKNL